MSFQIGQKVFIDGSSGFCDPSWEVITNIETKYDEDTGEPYQLIFCGGSSYRGDTGECITGPKAYYLVILSNVLRQE